MAITLADKMSGSSDNFNLLRFLAASLVIVSHSYALAIGGVGLDPFYGLTGIAFGTLAVNIFFVISGFLVTGSLFHRENVLAFVWARMVRIYPALFLAVLFSVFIVGAWFTVLPLAVYLLEADVWSFFVGNASALWPGSANKLPGVFEQNPWKEIVNGPLWTLPWEVRMYALLALGGVLMALGLKQNYLKLIVVCVCLAAVVIYSYYTATVSAKHPFWDTYYWPRFLSFFFMGSAFYCFKERIVLSHRAFLIALTVIIVSFVVSKSTGQIAINILLAYTVLYLVYMPTRFFQHFNKLGDYSYGLYIYSCPIQQSLAALIPGISVLEMLLSSFLLTWLLAFFSWHWVEKPMLQKKKLYVPIQAWLQRLFSKVAV